ncbi:MAG: hypothetical protein NZM35_07210 [Chitinophagales bacterium]|nr:hypothetical protein [Chitinophagales bacterium]MDW8419012.1 hypothetical protein [Chitinophagales bacterium]
MGGLSFQYPAGFIIVCLAVAAAYTALLYYRDKTFSEYENRRPVFKWLLSAARFLVTFILCVLLLAPFFSHRTTQTFKPIVAIVADNSASMRYGLGKDTSRFRSTIEELRLKLSKNYEVVTYTAGDALREAGAINFTDKSSNLSAALEELNGLYYNRNLGAVILATDGIYNKGINPVYVAENVPYRIYSIAVGDTSIRKDQRISAVMYNKLVYLNDRFALRTDVESNNLSGKTCKLTVYEISEGGSKSIETKEISHQNDAYFRSVDFILPANKAGVAHYRLVLENLPGEVTYQNNVRDIFVEVLDGRQKILVVAHSPHPDVAALKSAIESNQNYQVDVAWAENFQKPLRDYNLIIFHQLPSGNQKIAALLQAAKDLKKSTLFVLGSLTSVTELSNAQSLVSVRTGAVQYNDVHAFVNKDFPLFSLSESTLQTLPKLPPLHNFFGEYKASPTAKTLLFQKINGVQTDFPLLTVGDNVDSKTGFLAAEGFWRWRQYDYMFNKNHDATNEIIQKTVQYLSLKSDKRPFRVQPAKNVFQDNEPVTFEAQLYNANYEPVNTPEATLELKNEKGERTTYNFNKTDNGYLLNAGFLPPGNYSFSASTKLGNTTLTAAGKFTVSPVQLEELRTRADHQWMYKIAAEHGGSFHYLATATSIANEIEKDNRLKPVMYDTHITESAINLKWIFFLVIALLALEWGTRKYLGGY